MRFSILAVSAAMLIGAASAQTAQEPEPHQVFLASLAGEWSGVITYREEGEERRTVQVPVAMSARTPADGSYVVMETTYLDPDLNIFSSRLVTSDGVTVREAYVREGRMQATEFEIERIAVSRGGERVDARLIATDADSERPSQIRVSYVFDRGTLVRRTDVRFLEAEEAPFQLRDEARLARTAINPPRAPGDPAARVNGR